VPDRGIIKRNYLADFTILKNEILVDNLLDNEIVATVKGGEIVWMK
jgi:hypothetical protein